MPKDSGKSRFDSVEQATEYFKDIYEQLPSDIIKDIIEYCIKNPDKYPPGYESIDLKRVPLPKPMVERVIEGAVEIIDNPDDPSVKVLKHHEGATLLSAEEAEELQAKINDALSKQTTEEEEDLRRKYHEIEKNLQKNKLRQKIQSKRH